MDILVQTVEYKGTVSCRTGGIRCDGQRGILVPNSMEYDAAREIAADMGASMESSINISTDAGAQIASDLGKGVIQGVSQYVEKKCVTVKITLKSRTQAVASFSRTMRHKSSKRNSIIIPTNQDAIGYEKDSDDVFCPDDGCDGCQYAQQGSGDYYEGLSRKIGFSQMIPPHGLEITYDKTVHIIFPSPVRYVDLGSTNLIAGKADAAENVIRVKATRKHFRSETNMSVITEDGNFYTFNVRYADEPLLLNVEMCDFIHDGESVNRPNNAMEIYLQELGSESPRLVRLIMKSVHRQDKRRSSISAVNGSGFSSCLRGFIHTASCCISIHELRMPRTCRLMWIS